MAASRPNASSSFCCSRRSSHAPSSTASCGRANRSTPSRARRPGCSGIRSNACSESSAPSSPTPASRPSSRQGCTSTSTACRPEMQQDRQRDFRHVLRRAGHAGRPQESAWTKGCRPVHGVNACDAGLFDDAHLDIHASERRRRTDERAVQRQRVPLLPRHGDTNKVSIPDDAVGRIEVDPSGTRQVRLHPAVR